MAAAALTRTRDRETVRGFLWKSALIWRGKGKVFMRTAGSCHCLWWLLLLALGPAAPLRAEPPPVVAERITVEAAMPPWSAIGRLNVAGRAHCTATLVAIDLVLTAAQCLYNRVTGRRYPPSAVHFVAGYQRGEFVAHSVASALTVPEAYDPGPGAGLSNRSNDWALVTLARPLGQEIRPLALRSLDAPAVAAVAARGAGLTQAGYHRIRPHALTLGRDCRIEGIVQRTALIFHHCPIAQGDSGSPLLARFDDGYRVVGINSGVLRKGRMHLAVAIAGGRFSGQLRRLAAGRQGRAIAGPEAAGTSEAEGRR